jgi:dihydrofolate reductase
MGKVILGMTMSLDGFITDWNGSVDRLYPDLPGLRKTEFLQESIRTTGAVVMGRRAYEMGEGDFTGYEYQTPIFVLTHRIPENVAKGENNRLAFTFVTEGIERAIEMAKAAAGDQNVTVIGGANTAQQCINAGLVDELEVGIVPVLLGAGLRFFEHLDTGRIELESARAIEEGGVTYLIYNVVKDKVGSHEAERGRPERRR